MNAAMELLRSKAAAMYDLIAGQSAAELIIDPVETIPSAEEVTVTTVTVTNMRDEQMSKAMTDATNIQVDLCIDQLNLFDTVGKTDKVWIYNISRQAHTLGNSLIKRLQIPACSSYEEYAVATSIPLVVVQPKPNVDNGETNYFFMDGRRVAMDLINPSNLGLDQDLGPRLQASFAVGNDFNRKGVFFSTHNPPLKKEIKAAHKRLKVYYQELIDRANIVRITSAATQLGVPTAEVTAAVEYVEGPRTTR
jgi:hypothetical protein